MRRNTVVHVQRVQQWAQHGALWGASAECKSGGELRAVLDRLWTICEKFHNLCTDVSGKAQLKQLPDQYVW